MAKRKMPPGMGAPMFDNDMDDSMMPKKKPAMPKPMKKKKAMPKKKMGLGIAIVVKPKGKKMPKMAPRMPGKTPNMRGLM